MQGLGNKLLYAVCLGFAGINLLLISESQYLFLALPLLLAAVLLFFVSTDKLLIAVIILTPFSFRADFENLGFSVNLPAEPLVVALMLWLIIKIFQENVFDSDVIKHPVTIILALNLLWMLFTSITSEIPLVSFKYFMSRFWYVVVFFFLTLLLLKKYSANRHLLFYFAIPMAIMILYFAYLHFQWGFDRKAGIWLVRPFFNDHTNYSSTLALVLPFLLASIFNNKLHKNLRLGSVLLSLLFLMGIVLSFSRASWLSLMVAAGIFVIFWLKIPWKMVAGGIVILVIAAFSFQTQIRFALERNQYESSGNMAQHIRSMTNITTDISNLERINRWRAAIRMYQERPLVGWGPGTYQFVYAPFQVSEDFTLITTHFGDLGNAHSEYLGPLAESGLPGMLLFIALAIAVLSTGIKLYYKGSNREIRLLALAVTLGFITYFVHGFLNNFLDTDKASVPFWSMMAILVALEVYHQKNQRHKSDNFESVPESSN